jgi:hypothetical protein
MSANLFAAIRPQEGVANHAGEFICCYSPTGRSDESCRRIYLPLFAHMTRNWCNCTMMMQKN